MRVLSILGLFFLMHCSACNHDSKQPADQVDVDVTQPDKICHVHNIPLEPGVVPIKYGLPRELTPEESEAYERFPYARLSHPGGCIVGDPKQARVSFCPECRKAEAAWKEDRRQKMATARSLFLERARELFKNNPKFHEVHPFIEGASFAGIEGHVKSDADLAELRRLIEATAPPRSIYWTVRVVP